MNLSCLVCCYELSKGYQPWHFKCTNCGHEQADFSSAINITNRSIDEEARETGLYPVRVNNFKKLKDTIKSIKPYGGSLLDVGCAHGWFLEITKNDFQVQGLEPDVQMATSSVEKGLPIRIGYFPEALNKNEKFDVITFNDVIEHIADIHSTLTACSRHLNENGLLVLNLPSKQGVFYKLSSLLCYCGFNSFFNRLWQKDFPSPHLHYFNLHNMSKLLEDNGFEIKRTGSLPIIKLTGLYTRISFAKNVGFIARLLTYVGSLFLLPLLKLLPKDIFFIVASPKS